MCPVSSISAPDLEGDGKKLEKSLTVNISHFDHWPFAVLSEDDIYEVMEI